MKEELAISQGFGIMKNLNNSTEEKAVGENKTNTDDAKSGLSKFVCDRYPNIVAGNINDFLSKYFVTLYIFSGILHTLLFIHIKPEAGAEVSGHVDLNQRFADDPNFQKYMAGTQEIVPHLGDLTFHQWKKGKTTLGCSEDWEIITDCGEAELRHRNTGVRVNMDILQERETTSESETQNKRKGRKENKDRKSSTRWNEIESKTGTRIMYWDLYCVK